MGYMRSSLKEQFFDFKRNVSSKPILISEAMDLEFEQYCLENAEAMFSHMYKKETKETSLE